MLEEEDRSKRRRKRQMAVPSGKTILIASILTVATSSQGLLTTASKTKGEYAFNFSTVPFLAEIVKLLISFWLLQRQKKLEPEAAKITKSKKQAALFVVPSIIYWLHNNIQFLTLKYVDAPTYQILGNLKIVTTGLLFWLCLRRRLTLLQWIALMLLMVGAATSQIKSGCTGSSVLQAPLLGYFFGIVSAFLSALAAVYTEWVMKRNDDSLYWQNIQLYSFGILFNGVGLVINSLSTGQGLGLGSILKGYGPVTFLVVGNLAFSGLLVSWVMKFADSIMKNETTTEGPSQHPLPDDENPNCNFYTNVYATSMAMVITMLVSILLFSLVPSLQMLLGITTASLSLILYYFPPNKLSGETTESASSKSLLPK